MNADGQWQLAGNAAELYEDILVPTVFRPWATDLLELADLRQGERVLDVACGTGTVARLAAAQVGMAGEVTGLDLNASMLRVARSIPTPPGAPVIWVEGSALAMPLPDASFDVGPVSAEVSILPTTDLLSRAHETPPRDRTLCVTTSRGHPSGRRDCCAQRRKTSGLGRRRAQGVTGLRGRRWNQLSRSRPRRDGRTVRRRNPIVHGRRTSRTGPRTWLAFARRGRAAWA
jgi:SAM-dependent methyltransferase